MGCSGAGVEKDQSTSAALKSLTIRGPLGMNCSVMGRWCRVVLRTVEADRRAEDAGSGGLGASLAPSRIHLENAEPEIDGRTDAGSEQNGARAPGSP
jgi:hypothetical protein